MRNIGRELAKHWAAQGLAARSGNSKEEVRRFEEIHNVRLPSDLRDYLLFVDGMNQHSITDYHDSNGFAFWPLSKIRSAAEELAGKPEGYWDFPNRDALYVFADYMDWSWAYAILLSKDPSEGSPVFVLGMAESPSIRVANSFHEFVELYLADSRSLYEPPQESVDESITHGGEGGT